jgi:hypothetical protein
MPVGGEEIPCAAAAQIHHFGAVLGADEIFAQAKYASPIQVGTTIPQLFGYTKRGEGLAASRARCYVIILRDVLNKERS